MDTIGICLFQLHSFSSIPGWKYHQTNQNETGPFCLRFTDGTHSTRWRFTTQINGQDWWWCKERNNLKICMTKQWYVSILLLLLLLVCLILYPIQWLLVVHSQYLLLVGVNSKLVVIVARSNSYFIVVSSMHGISKELEGIGYIYIYIMYCCINKLSSSFIN